MFARGLIAAVAALSITGAAKAADPIVMVDTPSMYDPAPVSDWTGFYVGGFAGLHVGTIVENACTGICAGNFPFNGATAGIQAGADIELGNGLVIGAFAQVPLLRPTTSTTIGGGIATFTVTPDWFISGGLRLGMAVDRFLPYVHVDAGATSVTVRNGFTNTNSTAVHTGFGGGVGVEMMVADQISVDARYTYSAMGPGTYNWGFGASTYSEGAHNFTIGANFRF